MKLLKREFIRKVIVPAMIVTQIGSLTLGSTLEPKQAKEEVETKIEEKGLVAVASTTSSAFEIKEVKEEVVDNEILTREEVQSIESSKNLVWDGVEYGPENAIDGDETTYWQTDDFALGENKGDDSAYLQVELEKEQYISQVEILARQDHFNGGIKKYELYMGNDKEHLRRVKEGVLDSVAEENSPKQSIRLDKPVKTKVIKLVAKTGVAANVSIAELLIHKADIKESEDTSIRAASYILKDGQAIAIEKIGAHTEYEIILEPDVKEIPVLEVETTNPNATVEIKQISKIGEEAIATVTSEDGTKLDKYRFKFTQRLQNQDTKLKQVMINGKNLSNFNPNINSYDIVLKMGTKEVKMETVTSDPKSKVKMVLPDELPGTAYVKVMTEDENINEEYVFHFTVATSPKGHLQSYEPDYNKLEGKDLNWEKVSKAGEIKTELEEGKLKIDAKPVLLALDKNAPKLQNGEIKCNFKITSGNGRVGFIVRGIDEGNYGSICYDAGAWVWVCCKDGKESYGNLFSYPIKNNETYNLHIKYVESSYKIYINDEELFSGTLGALPVEPGYMGIRTWFDNKTIILSDLKVNEIELKEQPQREEAEYITLSDGAYSLTVDSTFPIVQKYEINGEEAFTGQHQYATGIIINGEILYPQKVEVEKERNCARYKIILDDEVDGQPLEAEILCSLSLSEDRENDGIVNFEVEKIEERQGEIKTIKFKDQELITVEGNEAGYGNIKCGGGWGSISDEHICLDKMPLENSSGTYAFLYNKDYSAAINTNVMEASSKLDIKHSIEKDVPKASFSIGSYTYRMLDEKVAKKANLPVIEELPKTTIIISKDKNNDGVLDWQDGAIAFRKIMKVPKGAEEIRNHMTYVAMNFISTASNPFLRVLDNGKVLSHYTDGFGQMIINKGYQSEGHDDSFPSFENIGIRHGGTKDFNTLIDEGHKYNIKSGVHVNVGEYMLDSMDIKMDNMLGDLGNLSNGWGWVDQAYYVDQDKDLTTGEVERRFEALKDKVPNLYFLYVDIYSGADWRAKKVADIIHDKGWMLATEFGGPFEGDQILTHWGTDLYYPASGASSKMYRFVFNHLKDMYNGETLLKGMKQPGIASWQNRTNLFEGVEVFYNQNLPTKYMQYFPIIKREMEQRQSKDKDGKPMTIECDTRVDFEQGVYVKEVGNHAELYSKDENLIAIMTLDANRAKSKLFIPWDPIKEDKIYHWNNDGGKTTWTLPNSWKGINTAYIFETTSTGRKYLGTLDIRDNEVTINAEKQVGYIITKDKNQSNGLPEETKWGEGSLVKDNGFESKSWDYAWKKSSTTGNTEHIQFVTDDTYKTELHIDGIEEARVEQEITDLVPGKTYTLSAWVDTERPIVLGLEIGDKHYETSIDNNKLINYIEAHRYHNTRYQRIRVDVTIPEDITTGVVYIEADATKKALLAKIDDCRMVELPSKTDRHKEGAVYFDDFENVDEGWGPFEYAGGPGQTHLAYKDPEDRQIVNYVIDGNWSLKSNEWGHTGELFRTIPCVVNFKPHTEYEVSMDYTLFKKYKGLMREADENKLEVAIKDESGQVIIREKLNNSELENGKPVVQKVILRFNTGDKEDTYFVTQTEDSIKDANILVVDNFMVKEIKDSHKPVVNKETLQKLINEAESLYSSAVEGTYKGEYLQGSKILFKEAIDKVCLVNSNDQVTEEQVKLAEVEIRKAIEIFKLAQNEKDTNDGTSENQSSTGKKHKTTLYEKTSDIEDKWNKLAENERREIKKQMQEYTPYTVFDDKMMIEKLNEITSNKFTAKQLELISKDEKLLNKLNLQLDYKKMTLNSVTNVAFKDVSNHYWAYSAIQKFAQVGLVAGYEDHTFKPNQPLRVDDTFAFLDRVLLINGKVESKLPRSTVEKYITNKESWAFYSTASIGSRLTETTLQKIITEQEKFISRERLAQVLYEVTNNQLAKTLPKVDFKDVKNNDYVEAINYCVMTGLLKGTSKDTMSPEKSVTRAEMMAILERLDNLLNK